MSNRPSGIKANYSFMIDLQAQSIYLQLGPSHIARNLSGLKRAKVGCRKLVEAPSNFIDDRPKAALLF